MHSVCHLHLVDPRISNISSQSEPGFRGPWHSQASGSRTNPWRLFHNGKRSGWIGGGERSEKLWNFCHEGSWKFEAVLVWHHIAWILSGNLQEPPDIKSQLEILPPSLGLSAACTLCHRLVSAAPWLSAAAWFRRYVDLALLESTLNLSAAWSRRRLDETNNIISRQQQPKSIHMQLKGLAACIWSNLSEFCLSIFQNTQEFGQSFQIDIAVQHSQERSWQKCIPTWPVCYVLQSFHPC